MLAPDRAGFDPQRLTKIDQHLKRRYIEPAKIAGALTLVARHGELAHLSPLGLMDRERNKPMQEDTIFRIYSMSKPITSVALMTLWEEGSVQLSDPVHRFIPAWRDHRVYVSGTHPDYVTLPTERPMTVKDLLTHQSGLTYGFMNRTNVDLAYRTLGLGSSEIGPKSVKPKTLGDLVEKLAEIPARILAWNSLELFGLHRRGGLPRRGHLRPEPG